MHTKKSIFQLIVVLVAAAFVLSSCAPAATPAPTSALATQAPATQAPAATQVPPPTAVPPTPTPAGPQGTLRVALPNEPASLYIPDTPDMTSDTAASQLYDPLIQLDDQGNIIPGLADSWDISPDGATYTFHLHKGVTFHNGDPFTSDDVVATWQYGKDPKTSKWPDKYSIATNVEKVDDYTVKVTTDGPNAFLLPTMWDFWDIIPAKYMASVGVDGFQQKPIGTGPFEFVEWVKGDHITYKANPNYWMPGLPKVQTLTFRFISDSATRVAAIQTGEVDVVTRLTAEQAQSLQNVSSVKTIQYPLARVYYIAFNNMTTGVGKPTMDPKVRQAMNYAVDVDAILKSVFNGYGKRAAGFVASGDLGYDDSQPFAYDPTKAKDLLTQAGYANGFSIDMACPAGAYPSFEDVCQAIVGYEKAVGITVNLNIMDSTQFWDLEAKKQLVPSLRRQLGKHEQRRGL